MSKIKVILLLIPSLLSCDKPRYSVVELERQRREATAEPTVTYNPASCKSDAEGMVYFALGREVFRRPYEESMSIRGMSAEDRASLPPRPDPSEPEGCVGNPLWGRNFSVDYFHKPAHPEKYPPEASFQAEQISLIEIPESDKTSSFESVKWGLQQSHEQIFDQIKTEHSSCEVLDNGLIACRIPQSNRPIVDWTTTFQADPAIYMALYERPFTVNCSSWANIQRQDCDVSYNYTEDTRIVYQFELHELPALEIIEFDKGLRAEIESMRVAN